MQCAKSKGRSNPSRPNTPSAIANYSSYLPPVKAILLLSSLSFKYSYTVNVTAWPGLSVEFHNWSVFCLLSSDPHTRPAQEHCAIDSGKKRNDDLRNPHHSRRDPLVERPRPLLLKHIPRNAHNPAHSRLARLTRRPLQTRLDRVDGRIAERAHCSTDQANHHCLITRQLLVVVCRLQILQPGLQLRVRGEIDGLVGALAERGEGNAAVECADAFFPDDGEESVHGVAVFGHVEWIRERVVLGL
jgi:hypothetical protein